MPQRTFIPDHFFDTDTNMVCSVLRGLQLNPYETPRGYAGGTGHEIDMAEDDS